MNRLPLCLIAGFLLAFPAHLSHAQSQAAAAAASAAYDTFSAGNYEAAATAYEQLLKDYPTDSSVPGAQVQLAFSYYFLGKYDQALATLAKASSLPVLPPEAKQITEILLPQILSSKAASLPVTDGKRKSTFEEAIKKFGEYITKYPNAQDLESAIYGKALAEYQVQQYDEAVKDLETNLQKFAQSSTIPTSRNLLAITLATQGSLELAKGASADKSKAFALYKRAADYLREIINKKEDFALINEANYQLGEILLNQAGFSPEAERPALYQEALAAFRAIVPKSQIIQGQKEKVQAFPARKRQALETRNTALLKQLDRDNERELKKLADLDAKTDQTPTAVLKMAEIFFQQQKNNEARVLLSHISPFLTSEDDRKRALYFTTMSYAAQNAADRAPAGYTEFMSKYKADALADNLPVTMGSMYLAIGKPTEAIQYFDESLKLYPNGRLTGFAVVQKAAAQAQLKNYPDAENTFKDFLSKNPPPEIGVVAQYGLANIYKDTQKWDDAIAAYKTVREKYPDSPQAVESDYWKAISMQQKGNLQIAQNQKDAGVATINEALPLLDAFVKANPKSVFSPNALYAKGTAQISIGQKDAGIATLQQLAKDYPESQPAPYTYFLIAQIHGQDGKADKVIEFMKEFTRKYPKDDKVYFAYDSVGQTYINTAKPDEAVANYQEFVQNYPEAPQAAEAMLKVAELQRTLANNIGRYGALNEEERSRWQALLDSSIATAEELLKKYPESPAVALDLQALLAAQQMLVAAELKQAADVEKYFQDLADSAPSPSAKSKILFALASYVTQQDKARALSIMTEAYNPDVVFSPQDLDYYGLALVDQKKFDEAAAVFDKLAKDYPLPPNVTPAQASGAVADAQSTALFGKGRIAQEQGKTEEAGKIFEQLVALYPLSPKMNEANYGIAQLRRKEGKLDDAALLLDSVNRSPTAAAATRAKAMLLGGDIMVEKWKAATDPKEKEQFLGASVDYYMKIAQFFAAEKLIAAQGLWLGGQMLEQQAATAADPKFKTQQLNRAKAAYQQLLKDYPDSEFAPKAQERLTALGAQ